VEHRERADRAEREADDMDRQTDRLERDIEDLKSDWESKKSDTGVPGAPDWTPEGEAEAAEEGEEPSSDEEDG
jgi:hypothetical protein